jgi:Transposase IS66 family
MAESPSIDGLGLEELKLLLVQALEEIARLKAESAQQRDEIARLKGLKGRPKIAPSGMETATQPGATTKGQRKIGRRGSKRAKLTLTETKVVRCENIPAGARLKGYEDFIVQDLIVQSKTVLLRRERWRLPDGSTIVAPLPAGVSSHFGPELKRFVLAQYHQGQTTMPRLLALLSDLGVVVSKRQLVRLLIDGQDAFLDEAREVLRTGLDTAPWITVDDTGARHKAKNGVCTQIGNDQFTSFSTTGSKCRLNFLELLNAGDTTHVINEAGLAYMREHNLSGAVIGLLSAHATKRFADRPAWTAHLQALGIAALDVHPDPVRIATEAALWGAIVAQGLLDGTVIVSDGAGQFKLAPAQAGIGDHALCWVHAERLVHKLDAFCESHRVAKEAIRDRIWTLYADLKAYARAPTPAARLELTERFEAIFTSKTGFVMLDRQLKRLYALKADLLMVLERPDAPLHTNGSENDIRCHVTRRKVSGGTRSDAGRDCRDAFLGLMKTCAKQAIRFWDYLGARLGVTDAVSVPMLPALIRSG